MSESRVKVFGTWEAPITDGAEQIDVPIELACTHCRENFHETDSGAVMPTGSAEHRECGLWAVWGGIGHHVDHERYCCGDLGRDAGLSRRQSALLVWECSRGKTVAEETLKALRDGDAIMCSRCGKLSYDLEDIRLGYCRDCR